jgi:hypothetical protein
MNDANDRISNEQETHDHDHRQFVNLASPRAPEPTELLHRIGLERRRSRAIRAASCAGWIGVGMAAR